MNKRSIILIIFLMVTFITMWQLRSGHFNSSKKQVTPPVKTSPSANILSPTVAPSLSAIDIAEERASIVNKRNDEIHEYVNRGNVLIKYYGRIVDQYEHPIPGVKVRYSVQSFYVQPNLPGGKGEYHEITSNADGSFAINGEKGFGLGIDSLKKDGYKYSEKGGRGGLYSGQGSANYKPDPNNPEVFTMIQLGADDTIVHNQTHLAIPCDGTPVCFDALSGQDKSDGDVRITFMRNPLNIAFGSHFSWNVKIEILGGGLTELTGAGTYYAPQEGYTQAFTFEQQADSLTWGSELRRRFYIKTRDNHYGMMSVYLVSDYQPPPARMSVETYINPQIGLRNLESNKTKSATW